MIDVEKFRRAMREIAAKKGPFTLFALFLRENAVIGWDLVVSSSWLEAASLERLTEFSNALKRIVGVKQLLELAQIVPIDKDDPALKAVLSRVQIDDGLVEVYQTVFFDQPIKHAIFLTAKRIVARKKRIARIIERQTELTHK